MIIELCRLVRDVKLSTVNFNGEEKVVLNNAVAIKVNKDTSAFVDITAWGIVAETIAKYFKKGDEILVKGEIRNKKSKVEEKEITNVFILVNNFEFTHGNKELKKDSDADEADDELPFN